MIFKGKLSFCYKDDMNEAFKKYITLVSDMVLTAGSIMFKFLKTKNFENNQMWKSHEICKYTAILYHVIDRTIIKYSDIHNSKAVTENERRILEYDKYDFADALIILKRLDEVRKIEYEKRGLIDFDPYIHRLSRDFPNEMDFLLKEANKLEFI